MEGPCCLRYRCDGRLSIPVEPRKRTTFHLRLPEIAEGKAE